MVGSKKYSIAVFGLYLALLPPPPCGQPHYQRNIVATANWTTSGASSLPEEVIRHIASRRDWTRLYSIKLSLAMNPKCSIPDASRILPYLREKDLAKVAKSRGVSSAVVAQALQRRQSGDGKRGRLLEREALRLVCHGVARHDVFGV